MHPQIPTSRFARRSGNPLIKAMQSVRFPQDHPLEPIYFFKGDVSEKQRMPQEGLDIVRESLVSTGSPADDDLVQCREAIATHYLGDSRLSTDIFMCNGGCMALYHVLLSMTRPQSGVTQVILQPELTFPFFNGVEPAVEGLKVLSYRLKEQENYAIDLQDLKGKLQSIQEDPGLHLSFVWVINPSNPQATLLPGNHLRDLVALLRSFPRPDHSLVPIVSDEIYWNMDFEGEFVSMAQIATETDWPVLVMTGLDKNMMVPGWNLSWLMLVDPSNQMSSVREHLQSQQSILPPAPRFLRQAVPRLLDTFGTSFLRTNVLASVREMALQVRQLVLQDPFLSKHLSVQMPQGVIYMLLLLNDSLPVPSDLALLDTLLQQENIGCFPCSAFQQEPARLQGLRLVLCSTLEKYAQFLTRLKTCLMSA